MNKARILKVRPGHLANCSGGAGYMPYVVMLSVPLSFVSAIISDLLLYRAVKHNFYVTGESEEPGKVDLSTITLFTSRHIKGCTVVAVIEAVLLFLNAISAIYAPVISAYIIPALMLAAGPVLGFYVSTRALVGMILEGESGIFMLFKSIGIYIVITFLFFIFGMMLATG